MSTNSRKHKGFSREDNAEKPKASSKFIPKSIAPYWRSVDAAYERQLGRLPAWLTPWVRDLVDVALNVLVIIVILRLLLGADMLVPLVVVTSESMVHESGDLGWITWLNNKGVGNSTLSAFPLQDGFNMGDMIVVKDPKATLGDVIIYERDLDHLTFSSRDPIIHRVVGIVHVKDYVPVSVEGTLDCMSMTQFTPYVDKVIACQRNSGYCPYTRYPKGGDFSLFITKGDHNDASDQCNPKMQISYPVNDAQVTGRAFIRLPYLGWPKLLLSLIFRILALPFQMLS